MMRSFAAGLVLLLGACATMDGAASAGEEPAAAPAGLISKYDEKVLREVVAKIGYKVIDTMVDDKGEPSMTVEIPGGNLAFQIEGQFCEGVASAQVCPGLELAAILGDSNGKDPDAIVDEINRTYRPGKMFRIQAGMAFERYLILDDGISRGNLASNIETFGEMLKALWAKIHD
jgi:hypothetical protein